MEEKKRLLKQKVTLWLPMFGICMAFSCCIYFLLLSRGLVNSDDGLWEYNYYKGGRWVLSLGRWFILYLDRLRFGISTEPITSLVALSCYSAGLMCMLDLFGMQARKKTALLACALFLGSVVICVTLSFRFTSSNYGIAFLFNLLAVWMVIKVKHMAGILGGGILIALGMGTYQAYIGCACLAFLGYLMISLCDDSKSVRSIGVDFFRFAGAMLTGAVLYILVLQVHLSVFHIGMAGYNGADRYSLQNTLQNLAYSAAYAYRVFFRYFLGDFAHLSLLQGMGIVVAVFVFMVLFLIGGTLRAGRISLLRGFLFGLLAAAVPLACNGMLLVATNAWVSLHMAVGMALCIPTLLCVISRTRMTGKISNIAWKCCLLLVSLLLYGSIWQVQVDQETMSQGKISTVTLAELMIQKVDDAGYLGGDFQYCILGSPNKNQLYEFSKIMEYSNQYARFGVFNGDAVCTRRSWQGVFHYLCGIDLELCPPSEYGVVMENPVVQNMPLFPDEGSILQVDDKIVIKISE